MVFSDIEGDLDRMESWVERNVWNLNKGKCRILNAGKKNPMHQNSVDLLQSSSVEKYLGVLVNKLSVKEGRGYPRVL